MSLAWLVALRKRARAENWPALALLLAAFTAMTLGLARAVSGLEFDLLWSQTLLALVLSWGVAASRTSGPKAALLCLLVGPSAITIQIGRLAAPLAALMAALGNFIRQAIILRAWPATAALERDWRALTRPVGALASRLAEWFLALRQGQPAFDPVAVAVLWLLALWATTVWAGWTVRRLNRPLPALLPALALQASALVYSSGSAVFLALDLALTLILNAALTHTLREQDWSARAIAFSPRSRRDVTWTVSGVAVALTVIALFTPSISVPHLLGIARDLVQPAREEQVVQALGLEAPAGAATIDPFRYDRQGGLPARHLIGSGPELSEEQVMTITIERPTGSNNLPFQAEGLRYWRGIAYDRYTGRGWETRGTTTITYEAGQTAGRPPENQRLVRQAVRPAKDLGGLLYAAGTLVTVDREFQVAWRARYVGTDTFTDFFAAFSGDTSSASGAARSYRVDSHLPAYDEAGLRDAGRDYPDWVAGFYLLLPEGISDRVRALARDLTVAEANPYDRALAIERYLRRFPYTLDLPAPPFDREIADYFLFELQRGYCDYYATTMVVLARAAGLPARLATGFVGGAYDEANGRYLITADLAHSWPEIYFPGYGWLPFEPTAGRPALERPTETLPPDDSEPGAGLEPITAARDRARWALAFRIGVGLLLLGAAAALGWWLLDLWRLRYLPSSQAVTRLYWRLGQSGRRLGVRPARGETPYEFAGRLAARLLTLNGPGVKAGSLASTPDAIYMLTRLYTRALFSPYRPDRFEHTNAVQAWSRLRLQLLWAAVLVRFARRR